MSVTWDRLVYICNEWVGKNCLCFVNVFLYLVNDILNFTFIVYDIWRYPNMCLLWLSPRVIYSGYNEKLIFSWMIIQTIFKQSDQWTQLDPKIETNLLWYLNSFIVFRIQIQYTFFFIEFSVFLPIYFSDSKSFNTEISWYPWNYIILQSYRL